MLIGMSRIIFSKNVCFCNRTRGVASDTFSNDYFPNFLPVPNVSFHVYAPGFISRFLESHAVMLQGNAGLKPKEGEVTSRPWQWPINYRVSQRMYLSEKRYIFILRKISIIISKER